jgi:hypothetical protein
MTVITINLDDRLFEAAREIAAHRNMTVEDLIRDYLGSVALDSNEGEDARRRLLELSDRSRAEVGPVTWKRDDLYER